MAILTHAASVTITGKIKVRRRVGVRREVVSKKNTILIDSK